MLKILFKSVRNKSLQLFIFEKNLFFLKAYTCFTQKGCKILGIELKYNIKNLNFQNFRGSEVVIISTFPFRIRTSFSSRCPPNPCLYAPGSMVNTIPS